jgi:hypothetical protein
MSLDHTPWTADLPWVTVTVTEPDLLDVTVFGVPYDPPEGFPQLTRGTFGLLMDHLYDQLRQPFTVEVIETDGIRETGTIDLRDKPKPATLDQWAGDGPSATPLDDVKVPAHPLPVEPEPPADLPVAAEGFLPGEDIMVATGCYTAKADDQGAAKFGLPPEYGDYWLLLLGRTSGVTLTRQPIVGR